MCSWKIELHTPIKPSNTTGYQFTRDEGHHLKIRMVSRHLTYSSGIPLWFPTSGKQWLLLVLLFIQLFHGCCWWSVLKCCTHSCKEGHNLFGGIYSTKEGGRVGGPIPNNFPVHIHLSISDKCFGNFPLTIESKTKQKGSWHALCKAISLWLTKNTWVAWLFAWNGVVIWVWIPNSTYNNVRLSFAGRTPMFWKSHYEVIIFF